jgi:arginase
MGVAHLLGDGAPALSHLGPGFPMLTRDQIVLFGYDPRMLEAAEFEALSHHDLVAWTAEQTAADPTKAAADALARIDAHADRLLVHFDVDAIDSTDLPLANYPHFNLGQPFDSAMTGLAIFCASAKFAGLVITEINPDHDADGSLLKRFIDGLVDALTNTRLR